MYAIFNNVEQISGDLTLAEAWARLQFIQSNALGKDRYFTINVKMPNIDDCEIIITLDDGDMILSPKLFNHLEHIAGLLPRDEQQGPDQDAIVAPEHMLEESKTALIEFLKNTNDQEPLFSGDNYNTIEHLFINMIDNLLAQGLITKDEISNMIYGAAFIFDC